MAMPPAKVWTPGEIAELTSTDATDVISELVAGRLRGFRIGAEWRVADASLQAFMGGELAEPAGNDGEKFVAAQTLAGAKVEWTPRGRFIYTWPDGKTKEPYEPAYEADVVLPSGRHHFVIGYANRDAAGVKDRRRVIVFLGQVPQIIPVVEFCGANDFSETRRVASVIKDPSNKHVRSQAQLPPEYQGFPTVIYSEVVVGPYAARSVAVLANEDDRDLMLRHAIIRATYKGMIQG